MPHSQANRTSEENSLKSITWSFSEAQLQEALDAAWEAMSPETEDILANVEEIPFATRSDALPYQDNEAPCFTVPNVPEHLTGERLGSNSLIPCLLCGERVALSKMRNHVGHHILWVMRGVSDSSELLEEVSISEPCGFCGRDRACKTQLVKKGGSFKVSSSCRYHYVSMFYASAARSTLSTPCTNIPIHCPLCPLTASGNPATIWKYNAVFHLLTAHRDDEDTLPELPPQFLVDMHILKVEESAMGVGAEWTERWREENEIPGSDDIRKAQAGLASSAPKRGRAQSAADVQQDRRKTMRTS
ncbi:hypothetical protein BV20DRAFT_998002 [Pilatotrama ljubarskyi]|nr:hypothetical protein BV20DRAFT_998002 [Pilatotrama ljubarskyi]